MKKVSNKGFTLVELLVVIGILGVLMGALFPAISSAMLSANLNTMSMQGRKLIQGIVQANIERQGRLDPVWPQEENKQGGNSTDKSEDPAQATSTLDFFNKLFNMEKYGDQDWEPIVDGDLLSSLWGCGVNGMSQGKELKEENVAWYMAQNISDVTPDFIPVLVTRNVNIGELNPKMKECESDNKDKLSYITPLRQPFTDKGFVIIRKSGAAETFKSKYRQFNLIFKNQNFKFDEPAPKFMEF